MRNNHEKIYKGKIINYDFYNFAFTCALLASIRTKMARVVSTFMVSS